MAAKSTGDSKLDTLVAQWLEWDADPTTRSEISSLADASNVTELRARLAKRIAFGTAGLRGPMKAGFSCMNNLTVQQASQGLAMSVLELVKDATARGIVVGYDGRHHSREFAEISALSFLLKGFKVYLFSKVVPTPFVPFAVAQLNCAAGVMVTASHNPKQDNGYKVYWENACQIVSPIDAHIAKNIESNLKPWDVSSVKLGDNVTDPLDDISSKYFKIAAATLRSPTVNKAMPQPLKIVYTAMHGVGARYVEEAFKSFDLAPYIGVEKQLQPDPEFPTVVFPNPEEGREALDLSIETADKEGATLIIATDPDADRLAVAQKLPDKSWRLLTGNEIGVLLASWCLSVFRARNPNVSAKECFMVTTAVSSRMLSALCAAEGLQFEETLTGFKWIGTAAARRVAEGQKFVFAYEEAIGFVMGDMSLDKDGVRSAAVFTEMAQSLARDGMTPVEQLERLHKQYGYHAACNKYFFCYDPVVLEAIFNRLRQDKKYAKSIGRWNVKSVRDLTVGYDSAQPDGKPILPVSASTQMITYFFENGCVATLRGSGTEPKLKYYIELPGDLARKQDVDKEIAEMAKAIISECLQPEENSLKAPSC